jgi:hypothetical protein
MTLGATPGSSHPYESASSFGRASVFEKRVQDSGRIVFRRLVVGCKHHPTTTWRREHTRTAGGSSTLLSTAQEWQRRRYFLVQTKRLGFVYSVHAGTGR